MGGSTVCRSLSPCCSVWSRSDAPTTTPRHRRVPPRHGDRRPRPARRVRPRPPRQLPPLPRRLLRATRPQRRRSSPATSATGTPALPANGRPRTPTPQLFGTYSPLALSSTQSSLRRANLDQGLALRRPDDPVGFQKVQVIEIDGDRAVVQECVVDDLVVVRRDGGAIVNERSLPTTSAASCRRLTASGGCRKPDSSNDGKESRMRFRSLMPSHSSDGRGTGPTDGPGRR